MGSCCRRSPFDDERARRDDRLAVVGRDARRSADRAAVGRTPGAAARAARPGSPARLDQHDRDDVRGRRPVVRLDRGPQPRHLLVSSDSSVIVTARPGRRGRPRSAPGTPAGGSPPVTGLGSSARRIAAPVEHRPLVQQVHRVAEQDLGLEVGDAVRGQQVVEVERERRVREARAVRVERRQRRVAPARVRRHAVEEEVERRRRVGLVELDEVGRRAVTFTGLTGAPASMKPLSSRLRAPR